MTSDNLNRHNVLEHDASLRQVHGPIIFHSPYPLPDCAYSLYITYSPDRCTYQGSSKLIPSTSRLDAFFGNNHVFNSDIFDETRSYWTGPVLDADMLANGKLARQVTSKAFNPNYTFTSTTEAFSLGEVAAPIIAFGDMKAGTVNRTLVEYFFGEIKPRSRLMRCFETLTILLENERLPFELGWHTREQAISQEDVQGVSDMIANATSLITGEGSSPETRRRDLHGSF